MDGLANKVVIITGASAGIGEATAILFSKFGSKVVITGRDHESLRRVSEACEKVSPNKFKTLVFVGDNTADGYNEKLINETIKVFGVIDILVNNAGTLILNNILSDSFEKTYDYVTNVNIRSPLMLTRLALPHLIKTKGCVVNISSVAAYGHVNDDCLSYHMSKAAMDSMTKILAHEFGPQGVRVLSVNPGWVRTKIHEKTSLPDTVYDLKAKHYPLKRPGEPEEVANVICFMASGLASFVTGSAVFVDGGHMIY